MGGGEEERRQREEKVPKPGRVKGGGMKEDGAGAWNYCGGV